ncbi:MAG: ABC transporter ATP-binding protein [Betaproteobacteria bacterium]|nr:ABC transporter ATP-binding protein [Betaproteobacteria bacterium]
MGCSVCGAAPVADEVLRLQGVVKRYGAFAVSDGVTLSVVRGELHALIGPNGAGKTTLVHEITGTIACDAGRIEFGGRDITAVPAYRRVQLGIARSYQVTNIFLNCSVLDNLSLVVQAMSDTPLGFWRPAVRERALFERAAEVMIRVGLEGKADVLARNLSHGQQRRLEVGLALATGPKLLLLDEPLAGMGPEDFEQMVRLIEELKSQCTVLMIEHDMDAVFRLADRISVLVAGRVIETGTPEAVRRSPEVKKAYLGDEVAA